MAMGPSYFNSGMCACLCVFVCVRPCTGSMARPEVQLECSLFCDQCHMSGVLLVVVENASVVCEVWH